MKIDRKQAIQECLNLWTSESSDEEVKEILKGINDLSGLKKNPLSLLMNIPLIVLSDIKKEVMNTFK